jgi:hypothetical protein
MVLDKIFLPLYYSLFVRRNDSGEEISKSLAFKNIK